MDYGNRNENGFELDGDFYSWHVTDKVKDLMLIDRFANVAPHEFFEMIDDESARGRIPVLAALLATSLRHHRPDWSIERVIRTVMDADFSDLTFLTNEEDEQQVPPASAANGGGTSASPSDGSKPTSSPAETEPSETLYATPA